jgi:hypothetical protein
MKYESFDNQNKKGFLLGEFSLKLIISIIGVLILIYLLFALYQTFSNEDKLDAAKGTLERLGGLMNLLADGRSIDEILYNPKDWVLVSYPIGMPASCSGKACYCICKDNGWFSKQITKCNSKGTGVCRPGSVALKDASGNDMEEIGITGVSISISKNGNLYTIKIK